LDGRVKVYYYNDQELSEENYNNIIKEIKKELKDDSSDK